MAARKVPARKVPGTAHESGVAQAISELEINNRSNHDIMHIGGGDIDVNGKKRCPDRGTQNLLG